METEKAVENIVAYDKELNTSLSNIDEIRGEVADVRDALAIMERASQKVEDFRDEVKAFRSDLAKIDLVFSLMSKASALKPFAKVGSDLVERASKVLKQIEDKLDEVANKVSDNAVADLLERVSKHVGTVDGYLETVEGEIASQRDTLATVADFAEKASIIAEEPLQALGELLEVPLILVTEVNDFYDDEDDAEVNSLKEYVLDLKKDVPTGDFSALIRIEQQMGKVFSAFDGIRGPLDLVYDVLKPIEPVLSAIDAITKPIVDAAVNTAIKTIGIDDEIDALEDKILSFLPNVDVLDGLGGAFDFALATLEKYDPNTTARAFDSTGDGLKDSPDPFGIGEWVFEQLRVKLMEVAREVAVDAGNSEIVRDLIGAPSGQGIGLAIEVPEPLRGSDGDTVLTAAYDPDGPDNGLNPIEISDLLLFGDNNDNTITATGGKNVLFGAGGNDLLFGGPGEDIAVFSGAIDQYRFSRLDEASPVTIEHTSPLPGVSLDGRDTLDGIEKVTFLGGLSEPVQTLTIEELFGSVAFAEAGNTVDRGDDTGPVFLFATGTSDTVTTLVGGAGNDVISGTTGNDHLIGNGGNDNFRTRGGTDIVDGGAGVDTLSIYDDNGASNSPVFIDLVEQKFQGAGIATLISVENVLIDDNREAFVFGDNTDNTLTGGSSQAIGSRQALISGRGGDDQIFGGSGADRLIGGAGADSVFGGLGGDQLVAGDVLTTKTAGDFYDGGAGNDTLNYSGSAYSEFDADFIEARKQTFAAVGDARSNTPSSGAVRIFAGEQRVERLSEDGTQVLAVDTFINTENFVGSSFADELFGGLGETNSFVASHLYGGAGNDTIHVERTTDDVYGGDGDDHVIAYYDPLLDKPSTTNYYGGDGDDTLDLSQDEDIRWEVRHLTSSGNGAGNFFAYSATESGSDTNGVLRSHGVDGFRNFIGSVNDDRFQLIRRDHDFRVLAGDGDDYVEVKTENGSTYYIEGGAGDDELVLFGNATAFGGDGADVIEVAPNESRIRISVNGEAGNDIVLVRKGVGPGGPEPDLDGGEDPLDEDGNTVDDNDIISATTRTPSGVRIDLLNGTLREMSGTMIDYTIANFETAIGSDEHGDQLGGDAQGNRLIGGGGNDLLEGRTGSRSETAENAQSSGNDLLFGGAGVDTLYGGDGDDLLHGGAQSDILYGGTGSDTASYALSAPGVDRGRAVASAHGGRLFVDLALGTAGPVGSLDGPTDTLVSIENIIGTSLDDVISGDEGDNALDGGEGADTIDGRGGDDRITVVGDDMAMGGAGNDYFVLGAGNATITGGSGDDTLEFDGSGLQYYYVDTNTYISDFSRQKAVWADTGTADERTVNGVTLTPDQVFKADPTYATSLDDLDRVVPEHPDFDIGFTEEFAIYTGTYDVEEIVGGIAVDRVASEGDDVLGGFEDNDLFRAGGGNDTVYGGRGDDTLWGETGNDSLQGGRGDDILYGGVGDDTSNGGLGDDTIIDPSGNSVVDAGGGADRVGLLSGKNIVNGGDTGDLIIGGFGNDVLSGDEGDDVILGDVSTNLFGNDRITGGAGDDLLEGRGGVDVFVFATDDGSDTIGGLDIDYVTPQDTEVTGADFVSGIDVIELTGFAFANSDAAFAAVTDVDDVATFSAEDTTITFAGLTKSDLAADDFILV